MEETDKQRTKDIATAFRLVAVANHYMVGFTARVTEEELDVARQFLIAWACGAESKELELALDLIEQEIKGQRFIR